MDEITSKGSNMYYRSQTRKLFRLEQHQVLWNNAKRIMHYFYGVSNLQMMFCIDAESCIRWKSCKHLNLSVGHFLFVKTNFLDKCNISIKYVKPCHIVWQTCNLVILRFKEIPIGFLEIYFEECQVSTNIQIVQTSKNLCNIYHSIHFKVNGNWTILAYLYFKQFCTWVQLIIRSR